MQRKLQFQFTLHHRSSSTKDRTSMPNPFFIKFLWTMQDITPKRDSFWAQTTANGNASSFYWENAIMDMRLIIWGRLQKQSWVSSWLRGNFMLRFSEYHNRNMRLLKPYGGYGKIKTAVTAGQELIILFRMDPYRTAVSFTIPLPKVYKLVAWFVISYFESKDLNERLLWTKIVKNHKDKSWRYLTNKKVIN